jgi:6-phosphogluconolactonase
VIVDILRHASGQELAESVAARTVATLVERISEAGIAHLCVTGGGIGTAVLDALRRSAGVDSIDWHRVHVWWGDERFLPAGDPERNETSARAALLDHVDIPVSHVHSVPTPEQVDGDAERAADVYGEALAEFAHGDSATASMDILMLGIGPDAHVASLFPELPAVRDHRPVVSVHGAPKPPPTRITMTFPTIRAAQEVWILASGAAKAHAVRLSLMSGSGEYQVPAAGARGLRRTLYSLDQEAASDLAADVGRPAV